VATNAAPDASDGFTGPHELGVLDAGGPMFSGPVRFRSLLGISAQESWRLARCDPLRVQKPYRDCRTPRSLDRGTVRPRQDRPCASSRPASVRSVRSPAYVLRTLAARKPANTGRAFAPLRTSSNGKRPAQGRNLRNFAPACVSGDGGNRTHVRDRVRMASTSVAGALISSSARLAGGVAGDQPP
jgi:hypothetical protein